LKSTKTHVTNKTVENDPKTKKVDASFAWWSLKDVA